MRIRNFSCVPCISWFILVRILADSRDSRAIALSAPRSVNPADKEGGRAVVTGFPRTTDPLVGQLKARARLADERRHDLFILLRIETAGAVDETAL